MIRSTLTTAKPWRKPFLTDRDFCLIIYYSQVIHMHPTRFPASGGHLSFPLQGQQAKIPPKPLNNFPKILVFNRSAITVPGDYHD
jgi:hypothetical protein